MGHYYSEMVDRDEEQRRYEEGILSAYAYWKAVPGRYTEDKIRDALIYVLGHAHTTEAEIHIRRLKGELE